eukprot:10642574-Heterocapsa_arctica.AAC.1
MPGCAPCRSTRRAWRIAITAGRFARNPGALRALQEPAWAWHGFTSSFSSTTSTSRSSSPFMDNFYQSHERQ